MKKMLLLLLAVAAVLAGCASSGANFKEQNISQLQPGVTTVQEAEALLGAPPTQIVMNPHGSMVVWSYFRGSGKHKHASLWFSPDGRFQAISVLSGIPISDADRQRLFAPTTAR